jgi:hypothetical protein
MVKFKDFLDKAKEPAKKDSEFVQNQMALADLLRDFDKKVARRKGPKTYDIRYIAISQD